MRNFLRTARDASIVPILVGVIGLLVFVVTPALAASIGLDGLINFVVHLIVVGLILWLLWWLIGYAGLPEPFSKIAHVVLAVIAVVILINLLLGLVGTPFFTLR